MGRQETVSVKLIGKMYLVLSFSTDEGLEIFPEEGLGLIFLLDSKKLYWR